MKSLCLALLLVISPALPAQDRDVEVSASPKKPWGDFTIVQQEHGRSWWEHVLLWVPNRVLDFVDIFRIDAGIGAGYGGVLRLTRFGQLGYRRMRPGELRVGDFGRRWPVLIERSDEYGAGPGYVPSKQRKVCPGEIGAGADLLVGLYGGVCIEEIFDFVGGIFFLDMMDDDFK